MVSEKIVHKELYLALKHGNTPTEDLSNEVEDVTLIYSKNDNLLYKKGKDNVESLLGGGSNQVNQIFTTFAYDIPANGFIEFLTIASENGSFSSDVAKRFYVNRNITIKSFSVGVMNNTTSGGTVTTSIYKNGVKEATSEISVVGLGNGYFEVTGLNISVSKGDYLQISGDNQSTTGSIRLGSYNTEYSVD